MGCLLHADGILRNEWRPLRLFVLISSGKFLAHQDFHISSCTITHCKDNCNRKTREINSLLIKQENYADHAVLNCNSTQVVNQSKLPIDSITFQSLSVRWQQAKVVNQPKLSISLSCQSTKVANQTKLSIMRPKLSIYPSAHVIQVVNHIAQGVHHFKLSINPSCQSSRQSAKQTDRHTVLNFQCQSQNRNSEKSYWSVFNHKVNSRSKVQFSNLLVQTLRMNIFQQSFVWKILNKGWHAKQWLKNGIHVTCIPQVWKAARKNIFLFFFFTKLYGMLFFLVNLQFSLILLTLSIAFHFSRIR